MKIKIVCLLSSIVIVIAACNNSGDSKQAVTQQDQTTADSSDMTNDSLFALKVADGGMLEVKAGALATTNGTLPVIQQLGKMLVTDHTRLGGELKNIASQNNITLPDSLSDGSLSKYNDLTKKTGNDFDKAFTEMMVEGHTKTIKAFQDEASNGHNAALRDWASKTIPTLQGHLSMCDSAADVIKSEK